MKKVQSTIELRPGVVVPVGALVRYYLEGWRCGHIESSKGATAKVRPMAGRYAASAPRLVNVPLTDIEILVTRSLT